MYATSEDVETLLMRTLHDEDELEYVNRMITVAVSALKMKIRNLDERMESSPGFADRANYVIANVVSRMVSNPRGSSYEVIGPFSIQTPESGDGGIWFLESELQLLGIAGEAFTIIPKIGGHELPAKGPAPWYWEWGP